MPVNKKSKESGTFIDVDSIRDALTSEELEPTTKPTPEIGNHIQVAGILPPPKFDSPEEAVTWSEQRIKEISPRAVQELEYQLKYGTEKARRELSIDVLNRVGLKEQKAGQATAPIIVIKLASQLPWTAKQKLLKDGAVTEAELVSTNEEE